MAFAFFYPAQMKRNLHLSKWVGLAALLLLILSCFMPWAWYGDLGKSFTGFYSERNMYGRPGKLLIILGSVSAICAFLPRIWPKRLALFTSALNTAYAIKTFIIFSACYAGTCPEKRAGIWLMLLSTLLLMVLSMFPEGQLPAEKKEDQPAVQP
jgi:hypothetical protein